MFVGNPKGTLPLATPWAPRDLLLLTLGMILLATGGLWGAWQLLAAHPWIMLCASGVACLTFVLFCCQGGLFQHLPHGTRECLLHRSIFDLIHDSSSLTNFCRRWGRIFLLCGDREPEEISVICKDLDPAFLDMVLRKNVLHALPFQLRRALVPSDEYPEESLCAQRTNSSLHRSISNALGVNGSSSLPPAQMTSDEIYALLNQKKREMHAKVTEPSLQPVIQTLFLHPLSMAPILFQRKVLEGIQYVSYMVAATAAFGAAGLACILRTPWARKALWNMVPTGDGKVLGMIEAHTVARSASWTSVFALMGAGACAALAGGIGLTLRRLHHPTAEHGDEEPHDRSNDRSLMEESTDMSIDTRFEVAKASTKAMPSLSNQDKLQLYALYKQATEGPVKGQRPGALDVVGRAKFDAWAKLKGMDSENAKEEYCALVIKIKEASK